jgi:hypothetical protein
MIFSVPLAAFVLVFGGLPLAQLSSGHIVETRSRLLAAPGLMISVWAIGLTIPVCLGVPLSRVWELFWFGTAGLAVVGLIIFVRSYRVPELSELAVPLLASIFVLAPYVVYGIADYPGSWFWDGWTYLASGEAIWSYSRGVSVDGVDQMYELGLGAAQGRFISSGLIAIFRQILPLNGDSQGAIGYFLLVCVFVLACACRGLARTLFDPSAKAGAAFVIVSTASGFVVTLIHANNFDQLLATSLLPLMAAAAFWLKWGDVRSAIMPGILGAAVVLIYPEMSGLMLAAPTIVLIYRILNERPRSVPVLTTAAIGLTVMGFGTLFFLPTLPEYFARQFAEGMQTGVERPGEGYFPTFFTARCTLGAFFMLYAPFEACDDNVQTWMSELVGTACIVMLGIGIVRARERFLPLAIISLLTAALAALILIRNRYDYGAYKILTVGFPFFSVMIVHVVTTMRSTWLKVGIGIVAGGYLTVVCLRLVGLDAAAKYKSVDVFRGITGVIPTGSVVALKIDDSFAFEWASYYLRSDRVVPLVGGLAYLDAKPSDDPRITERIPQVRFLISDLATDDCWGAPVWQSSAYRVYKINPPVTRLDCSAVAHEHS